MSRAARCRRPRPRQIGVGRRRACFRSCRRARVGGPFTQKPSTGSGQPAGGRRASASTSPPRRRLWRCRRRTTGRALPSWCSTHMRSGSTSPPRRRLWRCRRTTGRALPSWCSTHMRLPVEAVHRHAAVHAARSSGRAVHPDVAGRGVEYRYAWARRSSSSVGTSTTLMGSTCARTFWRRWAIKRSRAPTSALTTHQCRSVAFAGLPAVRAPIAEQSSC